MPPAIGQILQGRYRILRPLGQGGMGAVYLAEDMRLSNRCAVKESVPDPAASPQALAQLRQQFQLEARTLAGLSHPNLPKVTDYFSEAGNEYLVMEYVEGEDLASTLARHGKPLPEKPALIWADQTLAALEYLHGQRPNPIIHRDIKPGNVILMPSGQVKLVDFGLVKLFDPTNPRTATAMKGMGTPEYTPLEQYAGGAGHTDARSDIYALGATLYHLLTAVAPANAPQRSLNPASLAVPRRLNPALTPTTEVALLKALEIHPDRRFQTSQEMRQALAGARTGITPPAGPPRPAPPPVAGRRPNWRLWAGLAGLVVLILAFLVFRPGGFLAPAPTATPTAVARATTVARAPATAIPGATLTPLRLTATARAVATTTPPAFSPTVIHTALPSPTLTATPVPSGTSIPTGTAPRTLILSSTPSPMAPSGNLAQGKPGYASSIEGGRYPPSDAFDGSMTTRWSSDFSDPQWIYVDLGAIFPVQEVWLYWEAAYGRGYRIELSADAINWQTVYHETNSDGGLDIIPISGSGRYVRMYGLQRGTGWGWSLWEFAVYSAPQSTPTPSPMPTAPTRAPTQTLPAFGDLLFSDNFDDGNYNGWQVLNGTWFVTDGSLGAHYTACNGNSYQIVAGDPGWTDYEFAFDVQRISGWDDGGVLFRYSDDGYYLLGVHPSQPYGGSIMLSKSGIGAVAQRSWPFDPDRWYRLKVKAYHARIEVWIVESPSLETMLINYTDTSTMYMRGKIGFTMWAGTLCNSEVWYDNVQVAAPLSQ